MYVCSKAAEQVRAGGKLPQLKVHRPPRSEAFASTFSNTQKITGSRDRDAGEKPLQPSEPRVTQVPDTSLLDWISQTAADHGVDFTLSLPSAPEKSRNHPCQEQSIRAIQLQANPELAFQAIRDAGRLITLEVTPSR